MDCHIARNGQQLGVFAEQDIQSGLSTGKFMPDDLCWAEGMSEWQALSSRFAVPAAATVSDYAPVAFNPYAAPIANVQLPLTGNVQLADLGKRFGAAVLDVLFVVLVMAIPYGVIMASVVTSDGRSSPSETASTISISLFVVGLLVVLVVNIVMLTTRGQTPGKRVLGIRIAIFPGTEKPGFVKAVLMRTLLNNIICFIPCIGFIYRLVDICFIFQTDRRCVHDQLAGTHVIEGNPPA